MNSTISSDPNDLIIQSDAEDYITGVLDGEIVACKYIKLMCERHRADLRTGHERGLYFSPGAGQHIIEFFSYLRHSKGKWAGQIIELEPWQKAILWILFGWLRTADDTRRFRTALIEVARKNGKSTIAAGIGLYLMIADGEAGAEVYSAATKRDQARIIHSEAIRMVKKSPALKKRIQVHRDNLFIADTATKFEPLGRDSDKMDGLNVHGGLCDELHAHPDSGTWDVLESGTNAREQPLMLGTTTAGFDPASFAYSLRDYGIKILENILSDDAFFPVIFTLDAGDAWDSEENWRKSNPNLGVSVKLESLRDAAKKARSMPTALRNFKTKHLNLWLNAAQNWLDIEKWRLCGGQAIDEEKLRGRICFGGLDLSNSTDLAALAWFFPPIPGENFYTILMRFWAPEATILQNGKADRAPYESWRDEGYLSEIPGEINDFEFIFEKIRADATKFSVQSVAYDRWGAQSVYLALEKEKIEMVQMGQGFASMSAPMKEFEKLTLSRRLQHGNNPILTWNASNVVALEDPAGNIKPDKAKSRQKIDGIVAAIMALDGAMRGIKKRESVYKTRGIRTV